MNDKDQQNLEFLLNSSKEIIADWFAMMDHDEHMYALELLAIASAELHTRSIMLDFQEKQEPELEDLTMANAVLAQFLLK
jgi:hypothetical protein